MVRLRPRYHSPPADHRLRPRSGKARQVPGEPCWIGEPDSCARLGDAVNPAAFFLGRDNREPELLFESAREHAAHGVRLPTGCRPYLVDGGALGPAQQRDHRGLLRGARRLRIRHGFQRRPQAIDQRLAIADLAQPIDTGQAVPQGEQPLAVEPSGAQLVERGDNDLVLAEMRRRLAADDQVIGIDDVNTHEGGLHIPAGTTPAVTTLTLSSAPQATRFSITSWLSQARPEHGIARKPAGSRWHELPGK